ncbi:MAG: C-type lectin domain-containing protein [Verrucomicrobium sp.]
MKYTHSVLTTLLAFLFICCSRAQAAVSIGPVINPANGHVYYLLTANTWSASEAEAITLGGHLATINDAAEQAWVMSLFGSHANLWLGLSYVVPEGSQTGEFVWASGETTTYTNWYGAEPNRKPGEDYVLAWWSGYGTLFSGGWNDITNNSGYNTMGVVEAYTLVAPEPSVSLLSLLGLAMGFMSFTRRRKSSDASSTKQQ